MAVPVYYRVLGVDPGARDQAIHEAFHRLAALYQPDGDLENALAARRLRLITEAYAVLGDPVRRAAYDAQLTGVLSRSPAPLATPEAAPGMATAAPASPPPVTSAPPAEGPRRPTLWGRLRRRPFRSMGVVVAVIFVLLGAWARPQRPSTDVPLGAPPSILVPTGHSPLVAAMGTKSPAAVTFPSPAQAQAAAHDQASPGATKAWPIASRGPASHTTPIGTATPVPTHSAAHRAVPPVTPPIVKGSGTPVSSPTPALRSTNSRKQGGSDRAGTPARHVKTSAVAMAYDVYPDAPTIRAVDCVGPRRNASLPFSVGRRPGAVSHPPQGGPPARTIHSSPFRNGRPMRLLVRPRVAWAPLPAQGRGPNAGVPHGSPQAAARIVQA